MGEVSTTLFSMENLVTLVALVAAIFVSRVFFVNKIGKMTKKEQMIAQAKRKGNVAKGVCVDTKFVRGDMHSDHIEMREHSMRVKYEYRVNGVPYYKTMEFQSIGMAVTNYPHEVDVYYDGRNPRKAVCPEEATAEHHRQAGCYSTIVVFVLVFVLLRVFLSNILC